MKRLAFFFSLIALLGLQTVGFAQTKRALIVAIADYPRVSGWQTLSSNNDVPLIEQVLAKQGFSDTVVLRDKKADRAGIVLAIHNLINRSQPGDKVVIHFSSHGQQITDQPGGDEADLLDEAIVCYGAPNRIDPNGPYKNYDGNQHLRDEDLGKLIDELRQKLGPEGDVLLLADACHSGTITRGGPKVRGNSIPLHLPKAAFKHSTQKRDKYRAFMYQQSAVKTRGESTLAPYVAISAANASESNSECYLADNETGVGSLSYAFNRAMTEIKTGESYRDLFSRIQSVMKQKVPGQTPQIEGDYDRYLFGGKVVQQQPYVAIDKVKDDGFHIVLKEGRLAGLFDSTRVLICSNTARSVDSCQGPGIKGLIIKSGLVNATVQLEKKLPTDNPADYRVFITELSSGDLSVVVSLDSLQDAALKKAIRTELGKNKLVRFEGAYNLYIVKDQGGLLQMKRMDGTKLDKTVPVTALPQLTEQIQRYAQSQFLQEFTYNSNPSIQIDVKLIPLRKNSTTVNDTISSAGFQYGGLLGFTEDDKVALKVTNKGSVPLYYTVLDIMPNGEVNVIFPRPDDPLDSPENYKVFPNKSVLAIKYLEFEPPYGKETFKVFATTEPVDLRSVVGKSRGSSAKRGIMKKLEELYDDTNDMLKLGVGTRGTKSKNFDDTNICTFNYEFLIIDKKQVAVNPKK